MACLSVVSILLGLLCATTLVKGQLHRDLVEAMIPKKAIKKLQRDQTVIEKFNLITVFYADVVDFSGSAGSMSPVQIMVRPLPLFVVLDIVWFIVIFDNVLTSCSSPSSPDPAQ